MPTDPARLRKLIAAGRFEDVGRRLREASAADLAAIPTPDILKYLDSLPDGTRRSIPEGVLEDMRRRRPADSDLAIKIAGRLIVAGLAGDARLVIDGALEAAERKGAVALRWIVYLIGLGIPAEARAQLATVSARYLGPLSVEHAPTDFLHVVPVAATVAAKSRGLNTPGTYGYFLSRRGADKLLDKVVRDGYAGDIDWRLIAYFDRHGGP